MLLFSARAKETVSWQWTRKSIKRLGQGARISCQQTRKIKVQSARAWKRQRKLAVIISCPPAYLELSETKNILPLKNFSAIARSIAYVVSDLITAPSAKLTSQYTVWCDCTIIILWFFQESYGEKTFHETWREKSQKHGIVATKCMLCSITAYIKECDLFGEIHLNMQQYKFSHHWQAQFLGFWMILEGALDIHTALHFVCIPASYHSKFRTVAQCFDD